MNVPLSQTENHNASARLEDTRPATFFREMHQTFQRASQAAGGHIDKHYIIGEHTIRLRFAGPAFLPFITPALEHLAAEPCITPSLTVCLWDSVSTHTKIPPSPWSTDDYLSRGEVRGYNNDRFYVAFDLGACVLSMLDTKLDSALFWIHDACRLPYYSSASPLQTILHWWMRTHGHLLVHAAAVGTSKSGIMLVGNSGSGKSSTALACLNSELRYAGDDWVLIRRDPTPFVYSLYNAAKLEADHMKKRLTHLLPAVSNPGRLDTEKALIFLLDHYPNKVIKGFPVQAILSPRITGLPETKLKKASPAAIVAALAPSTIFRLPRADHEDFQNLSAFVKQVPTYVLELGTDLNRIPDVIFGLLHKN